VQWLADPIDYPKKKKKKKQKRRVPLVLKTVSFSQFNLYESVTYLHNIRCAKSLGHWQITAAASNSHETPIAKRKVRIMLFNRQGKFKIEFFPYVN